ncbi:queuosine precursor transporter [Candidatus Bipolaricaulota bacterium]|nr:queuosine precursor transporter [Candidatus Bipolaricaulota bacterium]
MDNLFAFNNVFWLAFVLVDLILAVFVFRFFGKQGLYVLVVASVIVANIQVTKTILLFGFTATLGNVLYGSTFFATDVLSELYGKRAARRGVWLGFVAMGLVVVWMQFGLAFVPGPDDMAHDSLTTVFGIMPRIAVGSLIAYLVSQHHDVFAFHFWKARTRGRFLWLRNCASTMVSQAIDSVLFCFIALWGLYDTATWLEILATTYVLKWLVALLDTPFIYLAVRLHRQGLTESADSVDADVGDAGSLSGRHTP